MLKNNIFFYDYSKTIATNLKQGQQYGQKNTLTNTTHPFSDSATDELTQASYKIAETLHKQQPTGEAQQAEKGTDENPIDAEINE